MTSVQALKSGMSLTPKNLRLLFFQMVLNAVACGLFYFFVKTPDASSRELVLSLILAVGTLFILSVAQAGTFTVAAQAGGDPSAAGFLRQGVRNSWRFLLAALPVALLAYVLFLGYGFATGKKVARLAGVVSMVFNIVWYGLLPIMLVTFWASVANHGLGYSFKNGFRIIFGRALRLRTLVVYGVLFLLFGAGPYWLMMTKTSSPSAWVELATFLLRLGVAYILMMYGWTAMAGAVTALLKDEG